MQSDFLLQRDLLKTADVVFMNNVLEFFSATATHSASWKFLMGSFKPGTLLLTSPSLEQQFASGKVTHNLDQWVKKIPIRIPKARYTEEELEDLREYHLYQILKQF